MKTELEGWLTADPESTPTRFTVTMLHTSKPYRYKCENIEYWVSRGHTFIIPHSLFDKLIPITWGDEPRKVKITIEEI